ncbi:MAG TPA: hypothetical protein VIF15_04185 [Polyangiaceae bacterium]
MIGIWLTAGASAVVVGYAIGRPVATISPAITSGETHARLAAAEVEAVESSVLEIPTMTISGRFAPPGQPPASRNAGVTEMQGRADDLIIGPGVVTRP